MLIHGLVVDERDRPLESASVVFIEAPRPLPDIASLTDVHGGFIVTAPVPGRYRLRCLAPEHQSADTTIDVADQDLSIVCRLRPTEPP